MSSEFKPNTRKHTEKDMFFDEEVDIQRFDVVKYPAIDRLNETQQGFFWRPQEVDLSQDRLDYAKLPEHEQHIFKSNIFRQILLDTKQGADPSEVLLPVASLPEVQNFITTWTFFEGGIHSRSYTHIIRNVYPDPSAVFDGVLEVPEILDCADDISKYYDELAYKNNVYKLLGYGKHVVNGEDIELTPYEHKKSLWKCLNSINILEGIRFYSSFACSWAFAENKQMEGKLVAL